LRGAVEEILRVFEGQAEVWIREACVTLTVGAPALVAALALFAQNPGTIRE
jgi:hypothetical protein